MPRLSGQPSKHVTKTARLLFLALLATLVSAAPSSADIGVIILEPSKTLGFLTRAGHAATYLSNICPDGSPVRMRLCHAGEHGGVVSKYTPISENGDYDWAIVPFEQFLNGFESEDLAPLIATDKLREAIQVHNFDPLFSSAIPLMHNGALPDGEWKTTLATRFDRTLYNFSIATTVDDDRRIVAAFNSASNASHFNFFYDNCSDQAKSVFALILPSTADIGDRIGGLTMETPKGLAKALVRLALKHPELQLHVERYVQTPGTSPRSREVLFPMENTYRNLSFAPYWFFGGFREFALGALVYHQMISRFSVVDAFKDFSSRQAAQLTLEQHRLSALKHGAGRNLTSTGGVDGAQHLVALEGLNTGLLQRLRSVSNAKRAEVIRVLGSKEEWKALDREFRSVVRDVAQHVVWPGELRTYLAEFEPNGKLSQKLLQDFEANGQFFVDDGGRGPWMTLRLSGSREASTGLSEAEIGAGDPQLALLVLASVIDYNLYAPEERRASIEYMDRIFRLFRQVETRVRSLQPD